MVCSVFSKLSVHTPTHLNLVLTHAHSLCTIMRSRVLYIYMRQLSPIGAQTWRNELSGQCADWLACLQTLQFV